MNTSHFPNARTVTDAERQQWRDQWQADGCVVVENAVDPEANQTLINAIEEITNDPLALSPRLKQFVQFERDYVKNHPKYNDLSPEQVGLAIRNIMETPRFHPDLAKIILYPTILDTLETLFESSEFHFHNYKCIIKAAKVSSEFRWHRDLPYLKHTTPNLITAMICLDGMTVENGATQIVPGSHLNAPAEPRPEDVDIDDSLIPQQGRVTLTCPPGSVVFFHVNNLHGGGPNRSNHPRRNLISIWAGPNTYPTTSSGYAYQGLMPRSQDPARQLQTSQTFP